MSGPRFYALWAINAPLELSRLTRQLEQMAAAGLDGVVFHPRFYPDSPPYLSAEYLRIVDRVVLQAKALGLAFWLYDENGWPSGTVGGRLLRERPEHRAAWLELVPAPAPPGPGRQALVTFGVDADGRPRSEARAIERRYQLVLRTLPGLDMLNPLACGWFLQTTHEAYRRGLSDAAFEHVSAFFSDEPEFGLTFEYPVPALGAVPWTAALPEAYLAATGRPLLLDLPLLFFRDAAGEYRRVRLAFWELMTDLLRRGFFEPYEAWCRAHGKRFTAHVKGEEHPLFQVPMCGSLNQVFAGVSLPGIDALERHPSSDFFPRQIATVAQQFGDGRCMVEAFGGAGWGAGPEDLERYLLWLGGHGLTDFVLHLWQYRLGSRAIRDWPPSHGHLTWRDAYP